VHQIRELIDEHPHTVFVRAEDPKRLARSILVEDGVISLRFERSAVIVETARPDAFYARLTDMAAPARRGHRRNHVAGRQPAGRVQVPGEAMTATPRSLDSFSPVPGVSSVCRSARCSGRAARSSWRSSLAARARGARRAHRAVGWHRAAAGQWVQVDAVSMFGAMIWISFSRSSSRAWRVLRHVAHR
jgi:hypothetical protein